MIRPAEHRPGGGVPAECGGHLHGGGSGDRRQLRGIAADSERRFLCLHPSPDGTGGCNSRREEGAAAGFKAELIAIYNTHRLLRSGLH